MGGCASRPKDLDTTRQDPLLLPQDPVSPKAQTEATTIQVNNGEVVAKEEQPLVDVSEEEDTIIPAEEEEEKKPTSEEEKVETVTVHDPETIIPTTTITIKDDTVLEIKTE